jgi:hypothetical protein
MFIKQYLFDIQKWEVLEVAERLENDKRIGLYNTEGEANKIITKYVTGGNRTC